MMKIFWSVSLEKQKNNPTACMHACTHTEREKQGHISVPLCNGDYNTHFPLPHRDGRKPHHLFPPPTPHLTGAELTWKQEDEELQVKVEGGPGGGLVLTDRGNDGDVILGIGWVKQGVETTRPRRYLYQ